MITNPEEKTHWGIFAPQMIFFADAVELFDIRVQVRYNTLLNVMHLLFSTSKRQPILSQAGFDWLGHMLFSL